ncbi:MAG: hypothetical protein IJY27_04430 [Clostridia bacterium]|nr:hypothetical protein [Clostridia bacterium]
MKTTFTLPVRLSEDMARKLSVMAAAEGRTPEAQFLLMLRNSLSYFERSRGKFNPEQIKNADLSAFEQSMK